MLTAWVRYFFRSVWLIFEIAQFEMKHKASWKNVDYILEVQQLVFWPGWRCTRTR